MVDFFFLRTVLDKAVIPIIAFVDCVSGYPGASCTPSKGYREFLLSEFKAFVYEVGRTYGTLQSDNEAVLKRLLEDMVKSIPGLSKRHAPRSSSASNSYVERAIGFLEAMCRTLRFHVESKYKIILTAAHPIVPWLVRHASFLVARFQQHSDGFTSFQRRWSKDFRQPLCEFTEQVWFRPTARRRFKFD